MMLRKQNEELYQAINELKLENERIECSNKHLWAHCSQLEDHVKNLRDTNDRLLDVIPQYKESINYLLDAIELHQQYSHSEYLLKVNYIKYTRTIAQVVDARCEDDKLVDKVAGYCLEMGSD
jgi:predicted nuclease with TOPRIM domain